MNSKTWRIWIDTGGTFTDCIATSPDDEVTRLKVLSSGVLRVTLISIHHTTIRVRLPLPLAAQTLIGYQMRLGDTLRTVVSNGTSAADDASE